MPPAQNHRHSGAQRQAPRPPPPPPIKYPIEDLDLPLKRNGVRRPELQFFTSEMADYIKGGRKKIPSEIEFASIGMLNEVWNTLNVQCEVYKLDSFTVDDFTDALQYQSLDLPCELMEEVHCAVLKIFVDDKGKSTLSKNALPDMKAQLEADEEDDSPVDESEVSTPVVDVPARSTRSRVLDHVDPAVENPRTPTGPAEKVHRVPELMGDQDWFKRIAASDFEDGGWQVILAGLLHNMSLSPPFKARCDRVLAWLVPLDQEPTRENTRVQWATMDMNLRISALQMITILSIATTPIKDFLEQCSEDMTDVRKKKIEHQKAKKAAQEELDSKESDRKIAYASNLPVDSPKQESIEPVVVDATEDSIDVDMGGSSDPDNAPSGGRLRGASERKRKRDDEKTRAAEEKAKKAEQARIKQNKAYDKILRDIEVLKKRRDEEEQKIKECDGDLR